MLTTILKGNHKSWDECLPHIEFAYNGVVHRTTEISPFEAVYGFNPLTPMDLLPLPTSFLILFIKKGWQNLILLKKCMKRLKAKSSNKQRGMLSTTIRGRGK